MGNACSHEVAPRGADLIEIHHGLLHTVLGFIFTHSTAPAALEAFTAPGPVQGLTHYSNRHDKACHVLGLCALISYILPAEDLAAAFVEPQPADWIAEDLEAAAKDAPLVPDDSRFRLGDGDRALVRHMQRESKRLHTDISKHNALSSRSALSSKTERRRRDSGRGRDVAVAGAYHVMDGDAKLAALHRALGLLARLVQQADLANVFRKGIIPNSVRRFVGMLPQAASARKEVFSLSRLVGAFEAERARLRAIQLERAARARNGRYFWPRWGNARPRPARTSHAPVMPPSWSAKETVSREPLKPNANLLTAIRGRARWKSGDLKALRVIQETARVRAIRTKRLSATWSCRTARDGEEVAKVGIVSAHTVAGRGSPEGRVKEEATTTLRAAFAEDDDSDGHSDSDETLMGSWETPATWGAAASDDIADAWGQRASDEESCGTEIEAAPRLPDEVHGLCGEHAWADFALYSSDDAVPPTAPQLEDFPGGLPLSEQLDLKRFLYLPVVHEMDPGDDQDAVLQWIMDDIEDVNGADS